MMKRKRIYVDRHVQGGIVVRLLLLWTVSTVIAITVWAAIQFFANPTEGFSFYVSNAGRHLFPMLMAFGVTLPIAVLHFVRFTHRFAGPIVRLRRLMRELAAGHETPTLKFRDNDYWPELAEEFNAIASQLTEARRRVNELERELQAASTTAAETDRELSSPVATL